MTVKKEWASEAGTSTGPEPTCQALAFDGLTVAVEGLRFKRGPTMKIKNWHQFQHFKDRKPPWIKLYRDILDDVDWHELDAEASKVLVMLWLIASEFDGSLPDTRTLAFRLRLPEKQVKTIVSKLGKWLDQDDIKPISERHHDDAPETETEREEEREADIRPKPNRSLPLAEFDDFWKGYPRKVGRLAAEKAYVKARRSTDHAAIMATLGSYKFSDDPQYIPHPATWLNRGSFLDEAGPGPTVGKVPRPNTDDPLVLYQWYSDRGTALAPEEYEEYDRCHDAFMRRKAIEGWK
jgi:hypothetical protein